MNKCVSYFIKGTKRFEFSKSIKVAHNGGKFSFYCHGPFGEFLSGSRFVNYIKFINHNTLLFYNKAAYKSFLVNFRNSLHGVAYGFFAVLKLKGVGFRSWVDASRGCLVLVIGYSHYILYEIPVGIIIKSTKGRLLIFGVDKPKVFSVSDDIQSLRYPDVYKGKGIQYANKNLTLKIGKQR